MKMNLTSQAIVSTLSRTLVAAIILGIVNCGSLPDPDSTADTSTNLKSSDRRTSKKYLELDDLNRFESPASHIAKESASSYASAEELDVDEEKLVQKARPKKFVKRSARVEDGTGKSQQQKRQSVVRQEAKQKQRPGFFWTLFRVTFETFNDTRSAIQQIGEIINNSIKPEPTTRRPSASLKKRPVVGTAKAAGGAPTANGTAGTTAAPPEATTEFQLTRPLLMSLVRRNVKGLVRLFNIEWRDAINQSGITVQEFRKDLGREISKYLKDNPNAY